MTVTILVNEMKNMVELSDEDVKKRIMQEGFPLQRFCAKKLQKLGWSVDEEYPVEQTIPHRYNPYHGMDYGTVKIRTSGDLRAIYSKLNKGFAIRICISCKRQLKIDWSFMKAMFTENVHNMIRSKKNKLDVHDYIFRLNDGMDEKYSLCNIPTNLRQNHDIPRDEDKIIQTAENLFIETSQSIYDDFLWLSEHAPYEQIIYVPMIVTAAKIHAYDVDDANFNIENTDSIHINEVPYLLYQHHLPRSMHRHLEEQQGEGPVILDKFNLFVVNYQHFENFIKSLMKKFEGHPM